MKLQEKDLRCGNLVQDERGYVFMVDAVDAQELTIKTTVVDNWYHLSDFRGIPLTEEWLLKFGFQYEPNPILGYSKLGYKFGSMIIIPDDVGWVDFGERKSFKPIEYVHQLQNLFYALTGEELQQS